VVWIVSSVEGNDTDEAFNQPCRRIAGTDEFRRMRGSTGSDMYFTARNPVVHLELHTSDLASARELYAELCGWRPDRIDTRHGSYLALDLGGSLGGGIVECETERARWLPYVGVGEINGATDRALARGASLLLPPREGPAGWRSVVATPAGGEIAFWQQKR
jgi:predicted enzyme related to lactoylglutathione lyase